MRNRYSAPLLALLFVAGCARNPVTGERQLSLVSEAQEIEMGRQSAQQVEQSIGLVQDQALQDYIQRIGFSLARDSERPNLPWTFRVVDDPTPNAFALPGGFIFVTRGMMGLMQSEAELAGVLGHEIGHVTAKHSVTMISRAQVTQLGLGLGMILAPELARFGDAAGLGMSLLFLKYGRDAERQADDLGFRYALADNYDVREMVDVFASLQRAGEASGQSPLPSWLASHPYPEERIQRIQQHIAELTVPLDQTSTGVNPYMEQIEGMVYGENPRLGFFSGALFMHPEMRFRIEFPQGWQTQNLAQAVIGGSPQQNAMIELTLAQGSEAQAADAFFRQQGIATRDVARQNINGNPAVVGYFQAQTQQGVLGGLAAFISHNNQTYQILAYASAQQMDSYDRAFRAAIGSFDTLTDPQALNAQPSRINIVRVPQTMTLAQFNQRYPSTIDLAELALINQVAGPDTRIPANTRMKQVTRS